MPINLATQRIIIIPPFLIASSSAPLSMNVSDVHGQLWIPVVTPATNMSNNVHVAVCHCHLSQSNPVARLLDSDSTGWATCSFM